MNQKTKKRSPVLDAMERQGILKGRKQGIEIGKEEGLKEGIEIGKKRILKILNDWANDSSNDLTVEELAKRYGYSVDEIMNADTSDVHTNNNS